MEKTKIVIIFTCIAIIIFLLAIGLMISMFDETKKEIVNEILIKDEEKKNSESVYSEIKDKQYEIIGGNLYYTEELIRRKGNDRDSVLEAYKAISVYLEEYSVYGVKMCIENINYNRDRMIVQAYQMIDGIMLKDEVFIIEVDSDNVIREEKIKNMLFKNEDMISNEGIIDVQEAREIAEKIGVENIDKMVDVFPRGDVRGEIHLEYKKEDGIYYIANINNGSYIKIDATTGKVIKTYFFDGIYY